VRPEFLYLQAGALLEILGLFTLFTNPDSILPHVDIGFEIPVILLSADIQGFSLFLIGSLVTLYGIFELKRKN